MALSVAHTSPAAKRQGSGCRHSFQALRIFRHCISGTSHRGRRISGHVYRGTTRLSWDHEYFSCPPEFSGLGSRRGLPAPRRLDRSPSRIGVSGSATLPGWVEMKVKCGKCLGGRRRTNPGDDTRCLGHATGTLRPALPRASSRRLRPRALPRSRARPSPRGRARRISGHVVPGLTARVATTLVVLSLRSRSRVACVGPRGPSPSPTAGVGPCVPRARRAARPASGSVCGRPERTERCAVGCAVRVPRRGEGCVGFGCFDVLLLVSGF